MSARILLVVGGGIAAYKALDLIRRLKERGFSVRAILTRGGAEFVTPLSIATLTGERCFQELFDLTDEHDVGHIRLARDADLVLVAPATADLMAKMANGLANDLASTALLATTAPILVAPAMNPTMWAHAATRRNVARLAEDGVAFVGPAEGPMAERGESGLGRMSEPLAIVAAVEARLGGQAGTGDGAKEADKGTAEGATTGGGAGALAGRRVLVTSGPTHEPLDPVRVIANRSSGRQGHAIAAAAARAGARVTLVSGPVALPDPEGVAVVKVETAREMLAAVESAGPADLGVFAAAVADWRVEGSAQKIKKGAGGPPRLALVENPDILATVARSGARPRLLVGFAAETENVVEHAKAKLARKGCDLIVANDVSPQSGVMGGADNAVHIVSRDGVESWAPMSKEAVAEALVARFAALLGADR